ncbi:Type I restriction-modification system, restriction subunit R (EC [uncultured Gammaproteobacteria bacterium]|nr:Type I restriction-modification system, restriction subunit R (EC [uncultured Gammaproteobacteria bacterium]
MQNQTPNKRDFDSFNYAHAKRGYDSMTKITENAIENFCIELLEKQGYEYIYAPDIAPDSDDPQRSHFEDVLLSSRLMDAVARINPTIPYDAQQEAIKEISRIHSPNY